MGRRFSFLPSRDGGEVVPSLSQIPHAAHGCAGGGLRPHHQGPVGRGPTGAAPGKPLTFSDIERAAHAIGQQVARALTAHMLAGEAAGHEEFAACPACQHATRVSAKKRTVRTLDGPIEYYEPAAHCVACRRDFFPQRPHLGLGERPQSPELQRRLTETAAHTKSFAATAAIAALWTDQPACSRTVTRLVEEVGAELVARRNATVDDFTHHRRPPEGDDPKHDLAVVFMDGGRVQLREEDQKPGVHGKRWAEDKVARVQTMATRAFDHDPCPDLPACFHRPLLHAAQVPDNPDEILDWLERPEPTDPSDRWQPEPLVRTCVASMEDVDRFRWMVQAEAKRRHFDTATAKAFVADGSATNWGVWERHFPDFEPIFDFAHVAEYVHGAAKAIAAPARGVAWAAALWQGRSAGVVADLRAALDERGVGDERLDEKHPLHDLQRAWTYLTNAAGKLDYPRYRRAGLPTTSSLIESQVKEYNFRLKGTEKFWHEPSAEALLEVVSWTLREDGPTLADYFAERKTSPFRRNYEPTLAA